MSLESHSEVMLALPAQATACKVEISQENWGQLISDLSTHVDRGQTIRAAAKCDTKRGKPTRAFFCVWITRTDNGRYEHGCNT